MPDWPCLRKATAGSEQRAACGDAHGRSWAWESFAGRGRPCSWRRAGFGSKRSRWLGAAIHEAPNDVFGLAWENGWGRGASEDAVARAGFSAARFLGLQGRETQVRRSRRLLATKNHDAITASENMFTPRHRSDGTDKKPIFFLGA